jgi:hypothetical protein
MKIEYLCHSCLSIETDSASLIIDPWFNGPAYFNQWYVFPKPVDTSAVERAQNILVSHGHEDHLHPETLKLFNKSARVFFPYQWREGITTLLHDIGFSEITEAVSFHSYYLSEETKITYIGFALESVIVIEDKGVVLVNLNDALNSHHQKVVDMFLQEIKKRWPKIDYLFSGWSGAGYFPNCVHYKSKDDIETGKIREQYFANHFCKIIQELQPAAALPFAPGFALLEDSKRWINEIKFSREYLAEYYHENFEKDTSINFIVLQPGDVLQDFEIIKKSMYHNHVVNDSLYHLLDEMYGDEIKLKKRKPKYIPLHSETVAKKICDIVNGNRKIYSPAVLNECLFTIRLTDINTCFNLQYVQNKFEVEIAESPPETSSLIISTTSELLLHSFSHEWGGDILTIGYGMDIDVFEEETLEKNLDIVAVRLLSRFPDTVKTLLKQPVRALKFFFSNPFLSKIYLKQKFTLRKHVNKFPYNERDHWISYSKCDLCQVCNLPLLSYELGQKLT